MTEVAIADEMLKSFKNLKERLLTSILALYFPIDRFFDIHQILFGDSTEIQTTIFHLISLVLLEYMKVSSAFWISVPIVAFSDPA